MFLNKFWQQFKRTNNGSFNRPKGTFKSLKESLENIDNEMNELEQNLQSIQCILNALEEKQKTALHAGLDKNFLASQHLSKGEIDSAKLCLKQQVIEEEKSQYYLMQSHALKQNMMKIKEKIEILNNRRDILKHTLNLLEARQLLEKSELLVIKLSNDLKTIETSNKLGASSTVSTINTYDDYMYKKLELNISNEDVLDRLKALQANLVINGNIN